MSTFIRLPIDWYAGQSPEMQIVVLAVVGVLALAVLLNIGARVTSSDPYTRGYDAGYRKGYGDGVKSGNVVGNNVKSRA